MSVSEHPSEPEYYKCVNCGGHSAPNDTFVAKAHGMEWACLGCVVHYMAYGVWP